MKIVFLDRATIAGDVDLRRPSFPHEWVDHDRSTAGEARERLAGATVAVVNKVKLPRETLAALPDLRMIAVAATGMDNVDLAACRELGIHVANVSDYAAVTVPEHTFALILALARSLPAYMRDVEAGRWQESGQFCFHTHHIGELRGRRLAIVGGGAIGQSVAAIGRGFGMEVAFAGRKGAAEPAEGRMAFDEILGWCDVITLHCPLTEGTEGLLGRDEFARMTRRPLVINTARGGLIVDEALAAALREGLIGGAGIDATVPEPPPADHPFMALVGRPDFILTPHVAWAGRDAMAALAEQVIANIEAFVGEGAGDDGPAGGRPARS